MRAERVGWPHGDRWLDVAWALFSLANLGAMFLIPDWETVPFHFIWVSLTLLYGFRVWRTRPTLSVLAFVMAATGIAIGFDYGRGAQPLDELTEVPLMAAMFAAMVWHARRRVAATEEAERVSEENLRLLERERRFVQDASHELRTPITVALGHAELIQRQTSDPAVADDVAVITDEMLRLRRLVDGLLLLAGSEDPEQLHRRPIDVEVIVVEALRRWAATPRKWVLGADDDAIVLGDADRLAVAFDALIENAVQHTTDRDTIEVGVRRRDGTASISFGDSGSGIEEHDLDRIFDRFARADPGRSRHTGGFGLGLSIVRTIVEAHGGSIRVDSRVGEGTTFVVALPTVGSATERVVRLPDGFAAEGNGNGPPSEREDVADPAR